MVNFLFEITLFANWEVAVFYPKRSLWHSGIPVAFLLLILLGGCSDDDPVQPTGGGGPTFANIWPAGVGYYWVFEVEDRHYEDVGQTYDRLEDVPPIPPMEELYPRLQPGGSGDLDWDRSGVWRYEFSGVEPSMPEVEAYQVEGSWVQLPGEPPNPPWPVNGTPIWTRSSDRISDYGGSHIGWVHLDGSLNEGHEFRVQLAEDLVSDVFLSNRIWQYRSFEVMGQTIENCLECFYVLDLGISQATDENGTPWGYFQSYNYGVIIYAPEIGPVFCFEQAINYPGHESERMATLLERGVTEVLAD